MKGKVEFAVRDLTTRQRLGNVSLSLERIKDRLDYTKDQRLCIKAGESWYAVNDYQLNRALKVRGILWDATVTGHYLIGQTRDHKDVYELEVVH